LNIKILNYIQYTFTVAPPEPGSDILIACIGELGFESFESSETGFVAYLPEGSDPDQEIQNLSFEDFTFSFSKKNIEQVNWNEEWEKNFSPVIVSDNCIIRAPFHNIEKKHQYDIIITPKMSFGTGHHDTTRLVCKNMLGQNFKNKTVLDMGCGTGVLAILAEKLGATTILGIDIDDWSVENAIENCKDNQCKNISIQKGNSSLLTKKDHYDIILANINKNVLKADIPTYSSGLKTGGLLFLSGFFKTDCDELINLASNHYLKLNRTESSNEWAVLILEKTQ
jgi:ribosomal protein L11 methyltransferase